MHVETRDAASLRGSGAAFIDATIRPQATPIDEEIREGAPARQDYVLDVSGPPQLTPRWRRIAISWIHAILLAELTGVVIVLLGLAVAVAVRGVAEIVSWLGRALPLLIDV
jgi:hypothetical protein